MEEQLKEWGVQVTDEGEIVIDNPSEPTRKKYSCPDCKVQVWGKPNLNLNCGDCDLQLEDVT